METLAKLLGNGHIYIQEFYDNINYYKLLKIDCNDGNFEIHLKVLKSLGMHISSESIGYCG